MQRKCRFTVDQALLFGSCIFCFRWFIQVLKNIIWSPYSHRSVVWHVAVCATWLFHASTATSSWPDMSSVQVSASEHLSAITGASEAWRAVRSRSLMKGSTFFKLHKGGGMTDLCKASIWQLLSAWVTGDITPDHSCQEVKLRRTCKVSYLCIGRGKDSHLLKCSTSVTHQCSDHLRHSGGPAVFTRGSVFSFCVSQLIWRCGFLVCPLISCWKC